MHPLFSSLSEDMDMAMVVRFQVMGELGWDHFRIRSWAAQLKGKIKIKKNWAKLSFSWTSCG